MTLLLILFLTLFKYIVKMNISTDDWFLVQMNTNVYKIFFLKHCMKNIISWINTGVNIILASKNTAIQYIRRLAYIICSFRISNTLHIRIWAYIVISILNIKKSFITRNMTTLFCFYQLKKTTTSMAAKAITVDLRWAKFSHTCDKNLENCKILELNWNF